MTFSELVRMPDGLIRVDYHGSKEVPAGTLYAIAKAAGLRIGGRS
jgi:predicted RNA binding protein YcfA (HicA-like mRNA interferase family)